jgi:uncharacterized protein (UPF0335 family)
LVQPDQHQRHDPSIDWVPRPDPTKLTTEQLYREVAALKEVLLAQLECAVERVERLEKDLEARPSAVKEAIEHLKDMLGARMNGMDTLREQKFNEVQMQFKERDLQVTAALNAAKELASQINSSSEMAITKSEAAFIKQFDSLRTIIDNQDKADDVKFADMKDRLNRIEGRDLGKIDTERSHRDNTSLYIAILAAIIGAIGLFIANYHKV